MIINLEDLITIHNFKPSDTSCYNSPKTLLPSNPNDFPRSSSQSTSKMKQFSVLASLVGTAAAAATTTLPASAGVTSAPTAIPVAGSFDGGLQRFERERKTPTQAYNMNREC